MKPKHVKSTALCVMIVFLVIGCATVGQNFPSGAAEKIEINKTTANDLLNMLGEPWRTGMENGKKTWTYGYYKYRLIGQTDTKDLVITFNNDGTVSAYTFNTTEKQDR